MFFGGLVHQQKWAIRRHASNCIDKKIKNPRVGVDAWRSFRRREITFLR
jgi:hypothetical protein